MIPLHGGATAGNPDIIKKHNSAPWFNEFVRLHDKAEYKQLVSGEDLTHVMTATIKKPYALIRTGPTLSKVVLCCNGGGRGHTFHFFDWELRRLRYPGIVAYAFQRSMEKRMTNEQQVPQERVGGGDCVTTMEAYDVHPALFITREVSYAGFKRTADRPYPPPTYSSKTDGCVVDETRFDDLTAAEAYSAEKKRERAECVEKKKARICRKHGEAQSPRRRQGPLRHHDDARGGGWAQRGVAQGRDGAAKRAVQWQISVGKLPTNKDGVMTGMTTEEIDAARDGRTLRLCTSEAGGNGKSPREPDRAHNRVSSWTCVSCGGR